MKDSNKTKEQLINELEEMRQGIAELEASETERKQAEEALRESEDRYHKLSEATFEGVAIHESGRILDANQTIGSMFGYELSELIGKHASELLVSESLEVLMKNVRSGYERPYEVVCLRKDGTTFPGEVCGKNFSYQGCVVRVATIRDITERKQAEEALKQSEDKFSKAFANSPEVFIISTVKDGRFIEVNESFTRFTGYTREEVIGKNALEIDIWARAEDRNKLIKMLEKEGRVNNEGLTSAGSQAR